MLFVGIPLPFYRGVDGFYSLLCCWFILRESLPFVLGGLVMATFLVSLAVLGGNYLLTG